MNDSLEHYGVRGMQWRNRKVTQYELHHDPGYLASDTYKKQVSTSRMQKTQKVFRNKSGKLSGGMSVKDQKLKNISDRIVEDGIRRLDLLFGNDHSKSMQNLHNFQYDLEREWKVRASR